MLDDMLALANAVCLLALSRSGRHVRLIAPCGAVFAVDAPRNMLVRMNRGPQKQNTIGGKNAFLLQKNEKGIVGE